MINCSKLLNHESGGLTHLHYSKPKAPVVVWNLSGECNLSCIHCYAENELKRNDKVLTTEEAIIFIDDLVSVNVPALLFSGGEPLMREDIFDLAKYAHDKGLYTCLSTNGTLITDDAAQKIKDAKFNYVGISLDGLEATHDYFRARTGAFKMTMEGVDNCLKNDIRTGVRFTLTKHNYKDLNDLVLYLTEKGINRFCMYHLVYTVDGKATIEDDLDIETKRKTMDSFFSLIEDLLGKGIDMEVLTVDNHADGVNLYHRQKKKDPELGQIALDLISRCSGCSAGVGVADIDAFGNVHPCQFWSSVSLGNVLERPFSEIWYDDNNEFLNDLRNWKDKVKGRCGSCKYVNSCGGCRLRAQKEYNDLWAEDPACYLTDAEIAG